jgi:hypothetical protein
MTDIPALIERLRKWPWPDCPLPSEALADIREAAAALQAQARENERLQEQSGYYCEESHTNHIESCRRWGEIQELKDNTRELEADLAAMKKWALDSDETNDKLRAERDAIDTELRKIACFIEPHWQGAGAKLEADWIIRAIGQMNSEADAIRTTTIEEILSQIPGGNICDPQDIADRIRALKTE